MHSISTRQLLGGAQGMRRATRSIASTASPDSKTKVIEAPITQDQQSTVTSKQERKTQAQLDEELRLKLSAMAGDGGEAGIEYEDGKPVTMKRGVRENMFRYI